MARSTPHKFALKTVGLTNEQAAELFYIICSAARALSGIDNYEGSTSVTFAQLKKSFPDAEWSKSSKAERIKLVS